MPSPAKYLLAGLLLCLVLAPLRVFPQDLSEVDNGTLVMQPKVSFDGKKLVFLANYFGSVKPFISTLNEDSAKWSKPEPLFSSEITSAYEIQYPQLNYDNTKLYFSAREQSKSDFDIYYATLSNGEWSAPKEVPMDINTAEDELAPAVSADEKKILFSRPLPPEAKADEFCNELFVSELTETGAWSEAEHLPPSYNTGCICTPYFSRDNKTFFYSSREDVVAADGKRVRKQFNVFWAKIDGLFKYNPKPLVSLIGDEDRVSFSIDEDSTVYLGAGDVFSKNTSRLNSQILSFPLEAEFAPEAMTLLTGNVTNQEQAPLESAVEIIDPFTTKIYQKVQAGASGYYQVFVPTGKQFSILATREGYSVQSKLVEPTGSNMENNFELFPQVDMTFNVFDEEYYFPIGASFSLYDSAFNLIRTIDASAGETTSLDIGEELNLIFTSENYFPDTLNLPFDQEVIFSFFDFDIELKRKLKDVAFSFTDDQTGNNLGLEIVVYNVTRNEKTKRTVKDGKITLQLRDGEVYEVSTSATGYSYYTADLDLTKEDPREVKAELQSVKNISIVLSNITFEYNSYTLNATSYSELNKLVNYLSENADYRVEISAHTDNSGSDDYNLKLSNLRASAVLQYLQDNSINKQRLIARGYGESSPRYPNDTEENMALNRRVEFKILDTE